MTLKTIKNTPPPSAAHPQLLSITPRKRAARLSVGIYRQFAECRDYGFKDQITRSGLSIPSNITEGMERTTTKEKVRYLDIARSSAAELRNQTYIGQEICYIPKEIAKHWINKTKEISAMLVGLERALKAARDQVDN